MPDLKKNIYKPLIVLAFLARKNEFPIYHMKEADIEYDFPGYEYVTFEERMRRWLYRWNLTKATHKTYSFGDQELSNFTNSVDGHNTRKTQRDLLILNSG